MFVPCQESLYYMSRPADLSVYRGKKGSFLTGNPEKDAVLRSFILPPEPDPDEFYTRVNSMASEAYRFFALASAVSIGMFDHLTVPVTSETVAQHYPGSDQIPELLEVLCSCGFVKKTGDRYVNTPGATAFLGRDSPYSQDEYIKKLMIRTHELWLRLPDIIGTGPVSYDKKEFFLTMVLPSMAANALTGRLQKVVREIMELPGLPEGPRMLDLGGGHGLYAIALARLNPDMRCTVFDLPEVIGAARSSIAQYGARQQVTTRAGDFFRDDFGRGYDIILSSSTPCGKRPEMLPRICDALNPGGYFVNVQGGDGKREKDCIRDLEGRMWRFSDEPEWRRRGGAPRPFVTGRYVEALTQAGMELIRTVKIPDPFRTDDGVTMLIGQKPNSPAGQSGYPVNMSVHEFFRPPWERKFSVPVDSR
jgi:SAM-dependent methyltransferase